MNRPSIRTSLSKAAVAKRDEALLAQLGYKQEFKRAFKPLEVFGLSFSIIGLLPSIASVLVYALPNGGASSMVWGWAVGSLFILSVGLSIGGVGFRSTYIGRPLLLGPLPLVPSLAELTLLDRWLCEYGGVHRVGRGIYIAILLSHAVVCSLGTTVLARLQSVYVAINILLCIAVIIVLPVATPKEYINSAGYALGNFTNCIYLPCFFFFLLLVKTKLTERPSHVSVNGWPNGFAFVLSLVAPLWTICSFDCAVHISEEASNAATAVPWAIVSSITVAGILGMAINIALAFCMGTDIEYTLNSPIGQPMAQIFFNSLGEKATLAVWTFVVIAQYMMGSSMLLGASRQTFAFARDGALPLSNILYRINSFTGTPVNTVWFVVFMAGLLGLLAFAGTAAINAIFTMSITSLYVAYAIPMFARFASDNDFKPGPFSLGIFSLPIGITAIAFMAFMIIVFSFPATPTTNAANMNYAIVVLGGVMVLSLVWYYFPVYGGIHWFTGPVPNIDADRKDETGGMYDDYASKEKSAEGAVNVVRV
ncbi:amino acid permease-domain-containing protein [Pisolithus orientalis]|uniref:amino acid permease-domain-containing protein n=1 Tax=Pisolithus orientalis TaxID=936130 RepID=UPI002223F0C3|nr:amino acid permease-domain-containing protein [Pisolithus orientalis]KAI5993805.1 amino acid permease-domain-containing protein [Pisolithus orientalis]